jgi:anti-sigma B factor antagonist
MICTSALDRPLAQRAATTTGTTDPTDTAQRLLAGGNSESLLSIRYSRRAGYTLVGLAGQMDVSTCDLLRRTLLRLLAHTGSCLVIDMGEVTFTDARGISPLVTAHRLAGEGGGWVRLARVHGRVRKVLDIARLAAVLPAYPSVADAAAATDMTF